MNEHLSHAVDAAASEPKLIAERSGAVQIFRLSRPKALNALDADMCAVLAKEIPAVARNPDVYISALLSNSAKAFCAGGDVVVLTDLARRDIDGAKAHQRNEYSLNWLLECFSKPTVSFIDGICMGSGVGLTAYNTHRIAGENYKWAMPEVKIGLFPDVGISHLLSRMPWPIGLYLGLTGRSVSRADAQWLRLVTHVISASRFGEIVEKLSDAQPVDPLLDGLNEMQAPGPIQAERSLIEEHFSLPSIVEIMSSLEAAAAKGSDWASKTLVGLRASSPVSLAITDKHIRSVRSLDIRETLMQDYRLVVRFLEASDFEEGVRAALRDKDGAPRWSHARVEDVPSELIEGYFAPLGTDELVLPIRSDMQAARV
ncbi:enoyl-CoA hydratase/isomerase family protein [Hyphomicrobium methylovorum]|uniref:3-hydroxyisobutyryl-CoA hydrolase n=1 Tax=Hyphomicrobium methylovorum TaxID=84 RepID=UPI0015E7C5D6|nr:enoyl-CoA hydratase/isomerase family protein [Hyphomicrobium methylovorum]